MKYTCIGIFLKFNEIRYKIRSEIVNRERKLREWVNLGVNP